jgi:hypothetical protein
MVPVKLEFLIKDAFFNSDIFLKIGKDYIKYVNKNEDNRSQILSLRNRNCQEVYLNNEGLSEYIELKKSLLANELNKETTVGECLNQFHNNYDLLRDFFIGICEDKVKVEYVQELGKQSIRMLEKDKALIDLFNDFKKEQPDQLIFKEMVAFLSLFSLKYFDKIPLDQLEKFNVSILLTDLLLNPRDVAATYTKFDPGMPSVISNHPQEILNYLPKEPYFASSTIINILKNHHELPDGSGYPNRLSYTRFDVFLCTYYIAEQIVLRLIAKDLKLSEISSVYEEIYRENKKFSTPNFKRVFSNFEKLIQRLSK